MSDILTDYREWRASLEDRVGTHSDRCHMWPRHERCMIHRLAAEVERLREAASRLAEQDATLSVCEGNVTVTMDATLTDEEREAVTRAILEMDGIMQEFIPTPVETRLRRQVATLRALLERTT